MKYSFKQINEELSQWFNNWFILFCKIVKYKVIFIIIIIIMSVLPKGRSFTASAETKVAVLPKAGLPPQTREPMLHNRCGSFLLLSALHSLFSIWTDLTRSEKIPGAPTRRWGVWIWLTGPSGLQQNSPQGLNIRFIRVFDQIRDPEIQINLRPHIQYIYIYRPIWPPVWYSGCSIPGYTLKSFSGSIGPGMGSTQPRENNWVATWYGK